MNRITRVEFAWILLLAVAFVNGAVRELALQRTLGFNVHFAHQLSCLTGVLFFTGTLLLIWKWLNIATLKQAVETGLVWVFATAIFETFILNRNLSWTEIYQTYNLAQGELWALVLMSTGVLPVLIFTLKRNDS